MSNYKLPYIPDKELYSAVMYAINMIKEGVGVGLANYRAAKYYKFETSEVAKFVGQFLGNCRKTKPKKEKPKRIKIKDVGKKLLELKEIVTQCYFIQDAMDYCNISEYVITYEEFLSYVSKYKSKLFLEIKEAYKIYKKNNNEWHFYYGVLKNITDYKNYICSRDYFIDIDFRKYDEDRCTILD